MVANVAWSAGLGWVIAGLPAAPPACSASRPAPPALPSIRWPVRRCGRIPAPPNNAFARS